MDLVILWIFIDLFISYLVSIDGVFYYEIGIVLGIRDIVVDKMVLMSEIKL